MKGYTNNIAYISAANNRGELKMSSILLLEQCFIVMCSDVQIMLSGKQDLIKFGDYIVTEHCPSNHSMPIIAAIPHSLFRIPHPLNLKVLLIFLKLMKLTPNDS